MYELPVNTHRYFVESVSEVTHARTLMYGRFIGFKNQIEESNKSLPKQLLETIKYDTRSTTGKNLRRLMILAGKEDIKQLSKNDEKYGTYCKVLDHDRWKVNLVREITDVTFGCLEVENFSVYEMVEIQNFLCSS